MDMDWIKDISIIPIFEAVEAELVRARKNFPENKYQLTAFNEEVGELNQAMMEHSLGKQTSGQVYNEAIQVITMAVRLIQEGDADFLFTKTLKCGEEHADELATCGKEFLYEDMVTADFFEGDLVNICQDCKKQAEDQGELHYGIQD